MMNRRLVLSALAVAGLAACSTPTDLDRSLHHASAQGRFVVRLEPPADAGTLQRLQAWRVHVATPDGTPVRAARIVFDGGMPQHGHGFPTRPRVTQEPAPGTYTLEGVKFSMTGWWDMRFTIDAGDVADTAVFNVVLDERGLQR